MKAQERFCSPFSGQHGLHYSAINPGEFVYDDHPGKEIKISDLFARNGLRVVSVCSRLYHLVREAGLIIPTIRVAAPFDATLSPIVPNSNKKRNLGLNCIVSCNRVTFHIPGQRRFLTRSISSYLPENTSIEEDILREVAGVSWELTPKCCERVDG